MATIFSTSRLAALLTLDVSRFVSGTKLAESALFQFGNTLQSFGRNLIRGPLVALGFLSAQAISTAAEFDELTAQLRAVSGGGGIQKLTENARLLGRTTKFTATEIQNLQVELAKLGFGTDSIIGTVKNAADITQVFGGDLVKTGNTIAEVTRQFSRENLSATRVADVMAVAFSKTALNTENFAQAMKNVGSISNVTNNDFVDTVTLLGLLANAGQKSGIAGTRLKGVLIRLSKELGVTGKEIDFLLNGQLTFNELIEFFRNRAGVAAAVIGEMGDEFGVLRRQLDDSNSAADAFASTVEGRLFFNVDRLKAATEDLAITFGTSFSPIIARLAIVLEKAADSFAKVDPNVVRFGANLAIIGTLIPAITFVFGGLFKAIAALSLVTGQVALAFGLLAFTLARGFVNYVSTTGALKGVTDATNELLSSLDERKIANVENLELRIAALKNELEDLQSADIDADILAISTNQFTSEIERLEDTLRKIDEFSFTDTLAQIEAVKRQQIVAEREREGVINGLLKERELLEKRINNQILKRSTLITGTPLDNILATSQAALEQEKAFTDLQIAFERLDFDNFEGKIEDLRNNLETADLSFMNIPQLEAESIKFQELLDQAITAQNSFDSLLDQTRDFEGFFDVPEQVKLFEQLIQRIYQQEGAFAALDYALNPLNARIGVLGNEFERLSKEAEQNIDLINLLNNVLGQTQDEMLRQQATIDGLVLSYADFGGAEGVQGAADKLADLFGKIREATASFGEQSNKIEAAAAVIRDYSSETNNLVELIRKVADEGFDLESLFELSARGSLQEQLDFIKDLAGAFRDLAVERLAEGNKTLAARANEAADAFERQLEFLQGIARRAKIRETVKDARELGDSLLRLDRIDGLDRLQDEAGVLRNQLREALINPEDSKLADDLLEDLEKVEKKIKRLTDQQSLNAILDRDAANELTINAAKVAAGFGDVGDSYSAAVNLEEGRLRDLLSEKDAGNLEVSAEAIAEAINGLLQALDARRIYEFSQSLQDFKDNSNAALSSFNESLDSGEFRTSIDAYRAGIDLLVQRVADARQLLAEQGDSEDGFLSAQIDLDVAKIAKLRDELLSLERGQAIVGALTQGLQRFGNELIRAQESGEKFADVLVDTFKRMVKEMLARLAVLTTAFIIASAFGVPVGSFGEFLGQGFGLPSTGGASSGNVTGLLDTLGADLRVEGVVSNNNIVISNQRGTRAIDRTFG